MEQIVEKYSWFLKLLPLIAVIIGIWQLYRTRRKAGWGKIQTICTFMPNTKIEGNQIQQTGPVSLLVEAVNHGPEEVTIAALKGRY